MSRGEGRGTARPKRSQGGGLPISRNLSLRLPGRLLEGPWQPQVEFDVVPGIRAHDRTFCTDSLRVSEVGQVESTNIHKPAASSLAQLETSIASEHDRGMHDRRSRPRSLSASQQALNFTYRRAPLHWPHTMSAPTAKRLDELCQFFSLEKAPRACANLKW